MRLVADDDEEIAWRAIIAFGLVRPTPSILNELIAAAMRWLHVEQFVGLAALDSIARLIGTNSLNQVEKNQAIAKVNQLEGVDSRWLIQFNRMAKGQVPYREFVASVGT
ncbi:MAG: hypothetical protein HZY74_08955 [Brevundimonas sp.]|nr:MAG: hypothetical protein HZY74_08955 [Brevundimonas sp.]